ncbi:AraC family transcriptional regulator [Tamlana fucoidanivorans]|uniref:Helix-turn-helix domain-containing protein n=1 Tax=Allotamlana fucoidanivorans TaxID=2583814 RepID=A0A5C4SPD8_9FLAO|nr:AraC family transcriptional regulator [Tamlana fucoidanivorans]TNJ45342.1 helix-turn-helix domain-containing protein [Tamlana fucoidanivorans]
MKAINEQVFYPYQQSFIATQFKQDYFDSSWHFHVEYELTYIKSGYGTRFVGASAELFKAGDLVLIGSQVPHYWRCDNDFYDRKGLVAESHVVQFKDDLFFQNELPEMKHIHLLLKKASSGVQFLNSEKYAKQLTSLSSLTGMPRLLSFYKLIEELSHDSCQRLLSTTQVSQFYQAKDSITFQKILNYIFDNLHHDISLSEIASKVHMSKSTFCKYFKKRTKKTFTEYVNKLRIAHASKLLSESDLTVSQICFESGFNSLSYFNRQFKKYKTINPKEYARLHRISSRA